MARKISPAKTKQPKMPGASPPEDTQETQAPRAASPPAFSGWTSSEPDDDPHARRTGTEFQNPIDQQNISDQPVVPEPRSPPTVLQPEVTMPPSVARLVPATPTPEEERPYVPYLDEKRFTMPDHHLRDYGDLTHTGNASEDDASVSTVQALRSDGGCVLKKQAGIAAASDPSKRRYMSGNCRSCLSTHDDHLEQSILAEWYSSCAGPHKMISSPVLPPTAWSNVAAILFFEPAGDGLGYSHRPLGRLASDGLGYPPPSLGPTSHAPRPRGFRHGRFHTCHLWHGRSSPCHHALHRMAPGEDVPIQFLCQSPLLNNDQRVAGDGWRL